MHIKDKNKNENGKIRVVIYTHLCGFENQKGIHFMQICRGTVEEKERERERERDRDREPAAL